MSLIKVVPSGDFGSRGVKLVYDSGTRPIGNVGKDASFTVLIPRDLVEVEQEHNINNTIITKEYPRFSRETSDAIFIY